MTLIVMNVMPESEIQANFFADPGEKRGEILAKYFTDFRPGHFQEKWPQEFSTKNPPQFSKREEKKSFFHRKLLGVGRPKSLLWWPFSNNVPRSAQLL